MRPISADKVASVLSLALLIAIVFGSILLYLSRPEPTKITILPPQPTITPAPSATPAPIQVYVTGAVAEPESMVTLPYGSRVEAAIAGAGGFTESADKASLNMADFLRDGDQVHVASLDEAESPALPTPMGGVKLRINSASFEALQTLPGVGPALAQRILDFRDARGRIQRLSDLDDVPGIGDASLQRWRDLIVFD